MQLPKYSMGVGDRFAHQGLAQLDAMILAGRDGVDIAPVWNKSHREHTIVGSRPADVRAEADAAVQARQWKGPYFVDADHIGLKTVDGFLEASDFFTLDVADWIGVDAGPDAVEQFVARHEGLVGPLPAARHRPAAGDLPADDRRGGAEVPGGGSARPAGSIAALRGQERPDAGDRGVDGRDRPAADADGTARSFWPRWPRRAFPPRRLPRGLPAGSTRAWITSATWRSFAGSSRRTWPWWRWRSRSSDCPRT